MYTCLEGMFSSPPSDQDDSRVFAFVITMERVDYIYCGGDRIRRRPLHSLERVTYLFLILLAREHFL